MSPFLFSLCLLAADDVTPAKAAEIQRAQTKAQAEVSAKYGNKKSSELSPDERRQMVRDQQAADKAVLDKAGVDAKTWARESVKMDRAGYAATQKEVKDQNEAEKKAAEAAKSGKKDGPTEVSVQRGFNDEEPVTLEEKENDGQVSVEKSLPPEVAAEQAAASEQDRLEGAAKSEPEAPAARPAAKGGKGGGGGRRR